MSPPKKPVRLVFVHHSVGENWISDNHGGLGRALGRNNYFVSDTNYGWGPNGIGDRTDILNWPEWFAGKNSRKYLKALYKLTDRNSSYKRSLKNPGGENSIIMFKSCFPNSNLRGKPNDGPRRGSSLTVGNAKAIYLKLLTYFKTRPDKLFIVIAAPPVLDRKYSKNARAFNKWLVNDWLKNYKGCNVAVFDFYNVLTGPGNHHRVRKNKIEHVYESNRNTLFYPSGGSDEHPSTKGDRKATAEYIPLLNTYYNTWKAKQRNVKPTTKEIKKSSTPEKKKKAVSKKQRPGIIPAGKVLDNFETNQNEWVVFSDEAKPKTYCKYKIKKSKFFNGKAGLEISYNILPDSWATCSLVLPKTQNWTVKKGISFLFRANQVGQKVTFVVYQGNSPDDLHHFEYYIKADKNAVKQWKRIVVPWNKLVQPEWDGGGKAKFNPKRSIGVAFAFVESKGKIWVDDICFLK